MNGIPDQIFRRWVHSFEEDEQGGRMYRPVDYPFPPARGRAGIEFRPDGTFIEWAIGPTDAPRGIRGRWRAVDDQNVNVTFESEANPPRQLQIVSCRADCLVMR